MCDGLSWRRWSALAGRRSAIGEGRREVMGERAVAKGKDALGGLRSGFLRGRGGPPPSLHPRPGCRLSLGAPPLPAGAGSAGVAGPCGQRELPRFPASVPAGLRATLGWVWFWLCWDLKEVFFLLRAPVSSSVKWASTFPGSVRTETCLWRGTCPLVCY